MDKQCSFNTAPDQNEMLLIQIKREIEELKKTTTATVLTQNGKIGELCKYLKDNLSGELRMLFDSMQQSGELDQIITDTVLSQISYIENIVYPIGHIKRYGGVGDGVTNDTLALQCAVKDAIKHNKPLIVDDGVYLIADDIKANGIREIMIDGEIINTGYTFNVGMTSSNGSGMKVKVRKINNIHISGVKNSIFDITYCEKLHIYADGDDSNISSTAYCQFYGSYCKEIIIESKPDSVNIGWINENVFRIKRVEKISMSGNYPHNNNHFEHINFEKGVLDLQNARNNYISARCEGGITVTADGETQANFIEREYYHRHYFGEDVKEDEHGTISFYPVNKLQTERLLLKIDKDNRNFPIGSMVFNEDGTIKGNQYNAIYHSNLIPIDHTFALKVKSDVANLRVQMRFYDASKQPIVDVDNFTDGRITFNGTTQEWPYMINSNVAVDEINFYPGMAKYVEYRVIFGTSTVPMRYITVKLVKYINTDIEISNTLKPGIYTSVPTSGYWERGTILYAKSPVAGASIGIVCVESGTPGVWKNWGSVSV